MLTFRMDDTNFAQGTRAGTRVLAAGGVKVDFSEFAADSATLGLWHLHDGGCQGEGTGLQDVSGGGHHLTNQGAHAAEDGYRFVRDDQDWMYADGIILASAAAALTVECWVKDWATPVAGTGYFFHLYPPSSSVPFLTACAVRSGGSSCIEAYLNIGGTLVGYVQWRGGAVDTLLGSSAPWHLAVVLDAPSRLSLYVNGVKRAEDTTGIAALAAGTYRLRLGYPGPHCPSCIMDEVRLSKAARYAADFAPARLLSGGAYSSPTFDSSRTGADWVNLARTQGLPSGTAIAWDVRAADTKDANGEPQAAWQPYGGDPSALPHGRYFQWRAALSSTADRLTSPAVECVDAQASEAGYNIYHATGPDPESLDYSQPWAQAGPAVTQLAVGPLDSGAVHWFGIRPVDARETASPLAQDELRLELDAQGQKVPDRPAGILALSARPLAGGTAAVDWRYRIGERGVVPQVFRVFGDGGTGVINYSLALGEVPYSGDAQLYTWTSGQLAGPGVHQLAVRAVAVDGTWDEQPGVAAVTPDASAPAAVDALEAEVIL